MTNIAKGRFATRLELEQHIMAQYRRATHKSIKNIAKEAGVTPRTAMRIIERTLHEDGTSENTAPFVERRRRPRPEGYKIY